MGQLESWQARLKWWLVAGACFLVLAQWAVLIQTRWVEDEGWYSDGAWTLVHEGRVRMPIFPMDPRFGADVSPPLYPYSLGASFAVLGLGIPQARAVSAVFAVGIVLVVFLLASDIAGPLCGILAAVLVATDTFVVIASRTARPEAENTFFCWLAVLLCYRAIQRHSVWFGFAAGAAAGFALMCHPLALAFLAGIGLWFCAEYRWKVWKEPLVWVFFLTALAPVGPYLAWCFSDAVHLAGFRDMWVNKAGTPMLERIIGEADRWKDFIGLSSQRVALPFPLPFRIHIAVILVAALLFVGRRNPKLAAMFFALLCANLAFYFYLVNKGPRYLVTLAPLFAVLLGYLVVQTRNGRWRNLAAAAVAAVFVTQIAANAYWIYRFRSADYPRVTAQLREIIPPGASVFSITTFWMALYDRTYYAYDRTPFSALEKLHPQYLILYDRVMMHGTGHGEDDFAALRAAGADLVRRHGTLAGRVSNEFYGDLEVYRVSY